MKTFYIQQKIKLVINQYMVFEGSEAGEQEKLVAFAEQKRFSFREKFTLYTDESKSDILLEVKARQVIDFGARYDIKDKSGKVIGVAGKAFGASLLKSTWHIFKSDQEDKPFLIVRERNAVLAIVRRVWEILPYIGDIPFFVKYHFDFVDPETNQVKATYDKTTTFKDHYRLDIQDEALKDLDWRVFIGMGVMLDALQSR
jgi:uncharacterized protein YxjI